MYEEICMFIARLFYGEEISALTPDVVIANYGSATVNGFLWGIFVMLLVWVIVSTIKGLVKYFINKAR